MTWPLVRLGDVVSVDSRTARPEEFQTTDIYVGLDNIGPDGVLENLEATDATTLKSNKSRFDASHVLFGKLRPYLVNVARPDHPGICSTDILTIRPGEVMSRDFLYWWLRRPSTIERATEFSTGATLPRISPKALLEFEVPLPSPETQERVVALLDEVTAAVAELEAVYSQTASRLDDLWTSALAAAMEGSDWPSVPLGDVCDLYQPKTISTKDLDPAGKFLVYGANGPIGRYNAFNHENPEVVVTCRGATCGVVNRTPANVWITGNAMVVRPKEQGLLQDWLFYSLKRLDYSTIITGAAQPQITRKSFAPTHIGVPTTDDQERIVAYLDEVSAAAEEALELAGARLEAARSLRQSVLEAAFRGEF